MANNNNFHPRIIDVYQIHAFYSTITIFLRLRYLARDTAATTENSTAGIKWLPVVLLDQNHISHGRGLFRGLLTRVHITAIKLIIYSTHNIQVRVGIHAVVVVP